MPRRSSLILLLSLTVLWVAACYGVRFGLLENGQWVDVCADNDAQLACQLRSGLGLLIHFGVLGQAALVAALLGFFVPGRIGWWLAALALFIGLPALVFYSVSMAVFAVVLAGLRLVRQAAQA
ncbi:hypothetical protein [Pseudomonas panipatensis]|jgi:hypothetical protein|uniref:Uncharacterized protein n=1 Tax=Pseudomonas panipatensis TaxID=428992 RepID=A0A1G8GJ63_9PSED|nr:hypothetical protein [Pseudomonas panipatensis]SDH94435.1 hypothetical protein SAMN05216272_104306 [Pseudomonas panipatensis]SMP42984.1 hypothetical protein SAMN06295951_101678 [Pseudomonas panipatensis]